MRALQVDRLRTWQTGAKVSAQARPSQWDSIRPNQYTVQFGAALMGDGRGNSDGGWGEATMMGGGEGQL